MADLNAYKYVALKSKKMFEFIPNISSVYCSDIEKSRLGFYHLILEKITGLTDSFDVQDIIQDTNYLRQISGENQEDLGIDAVFINEESLPEKEIMLFNFKYRESFSPDKTTDGNSIPISTIFLQYISESSDLPSKISKNSKVYKNLMRIRECLASTNIYNLTLYFITNEANGFSANCDETIHNFEKNYGMEIKCISLDDIISFLDLDREEISAKTIINNNDMLTYSRDDKATDKSYICKLSLFDLIRITCSDEGLREKYNIDRDEEILNCNLKYSVLYDNVRGYLGQTNYNKNIIKTLEKQPENFFMFNNGITITCKEITSENKSGNTKYLLQLKDYQIVNGGQTLRAAYIYLKNNPSLEKLARLSRACILVRIFKISEDAKLRNNIAEYTNSQNAISPLDLKSVDNIQIDLEKYLREQDVLYIRKSGDVGVDNKPYTYRISMEKFTQILHASQGYPERVSNLKKKLFSEWYDEIYEDGKFELTSAKKLIENYFKIEAYYSKANVQKYDQKTFYIVFLTNKFHLDIPTADNALSSALRSFPSSLADSRKMLKGDFKSYLVDSVKTMADSE